MNFKKEKHYRTIYDWLSEYHKYHKNSTNKLIHFICVPLIMLTLFGLISLINTSVSVMEYNINILQIFIVSTLIYYMRLSLALSFGMLIISLLFYFIVFELKQTLMMNQLLLCYISIFVISWIGQFLGHKIEGKKPAFFKDLQFLLIGPLWIMSFIYNRLNIKI